MKPCPMTQTNLEELFLSFKRWHWHPAGFLKCVSTAFAQSLKRHKLLDMCHHDHPEHHKRNSVVGHQIHTHIQYRVLMQYKYTYFAICTVVQLQHCHSVLQLPQKHCHVHSKQLCLSQTKYSKFKNSTRLYSQRICDSITKLLPTAMSLMPTKTGDNA